MRKLVISFFFLFSFISYSKCGRKKVNSLALENLVLVKGIVTKSNNRKGLMGIIDSIFEEKQTVNVFKMNVESVNGRPKTFVLNFKYPRLNKKDGEFRFYEEDNIAIFIDKVEGKKAIVQSATCKPAYFDLNKKRDRIEYMHLLKRLEIKRNSK